MKNVLVLLLTASIAQGCYMGKDLVAPASIFIEDASGDADVSVGSATKYFQKNTTSEYKAAYIAGLKTELESSNVLVIEEAGKADYLIQLNKLVCKESTTQESVKDTASEQNGETYTLHACTVSMECIFYEGDKEKKLKSWNVTADKDEKLTNNRNVGQIITGGNKERVVYRYKTLSENIFLELSSKCGKRTGANITSKISKQRR